MALLQIAEPGQSSAPHQHRIADWYRPQEQHTH